MQLTMTYNCGMGCQIYHGTTRHPCCGSTPPCVTPVLRPALHQYAGRSTTVCLLGVLLYACPDEWNVGYVPGDSMGFACAKNG